MVNNKKSISQTAAARQKLVQQHRMMHQAIQKAKVRNAQSDRTNVSKLD